MDDAQKENERQALRAAQAEARGEEAPPLSEQPGSSGRQWTYIIGFVLLVVAASFFAWPCAGFRFKIFKGGAAAIQVVRLHCDSTEDVCDCTWEGDDEGLVTMCSAKSSEGTELKCFVAIVDTF